jgi:hypothetical protein
MYNSDTPLRAELPSSRQLLRSTIVAAIAAAGLLVGVVLPAEYGVDPTGVGRVLRLTEMGEIKVRLAREAAEESIKAAPDSATPAPIAAAPAPSLPSQPSQPSQTSQTSLPPQPSLANDPARAAEPVNQPAAWRDEITFTLTPGEGIEIKMRMQQGGKAVYAWNVENGVVNFDTHGDGGGRSISYEKGRAVAADEGTLLAAFTGNHGWFWRNRGASDAKVVLRTRGDYSEIKRVK